MPKKRGLCRGVFKKMFARDKLKTVSNKVFFKDSHRINDLKNTLLFIFSRVISKLKKKLLSKPWKEKGTIEFLYTRAI